MRLRRAIVSIALATIVVSLVPLAPSAPALRTWFAPPAFAEGALTTVEGISIGAAPVVVEIPRIELEESSLAEPEIAAIFEAKDLASLSQQLQRLDAKRARIPEIIVKVTSPAGEQVTTYRDTTIEEIVAGRIGLLRMAGATQNAPIAPGFTMTGTIGAMELKGFDLAGTVRLLTTKAEGAGGPAVMLYESYVMDGYRFEVPGLMRIAMGKAVGGGFGIKPLSFAFGDMMTSMMAVPQPQPGEPPKPEDMQKIMAMMPAMLELVRNISTGAFSVESVEFQMGPPEQSVETRIARLSWGEFSDLKLKDMSLEGLTFTMPDGRASLGRFSLTGLDIKDMMASYEAMMGQLATAMAAGQAEAVSPPMLAIAAPRFDEFALEGLAIDVPAGDLAAVTGTSNRFRAYADKMALAVRRWIGVSPVDMTLTVDDLSMQPEAFGPEVKSLIGGAEMITVSSDLELRYDEAAQRLTMEKATLRSPNIGEMALQAEVAKVAPSAFDLMNIESGQTAAMSAASVTSATLEVKDSGMLAAVLASLAAQQGRTADQLRDEWIVLTRASLAVLLASDPSAAIAISDAVEGFLRGGGPLKIAATSAAGMPISALEAGPGLPPDVAIKATVGQ